jgi:hypothetical protein
MSIVKPPAKEVLKGMFIPKLNGSSATADAIALLGALVMPQVIHKIAPQCSGYNLRSITHDMIASSCEH